MNILYLGIFVRILVQYINLYIYPISGLNEDPALFHFLGTEIANNGFFSESFYQDNKFYSYSIFLGYIYKLLHVSNIFIGSLINIFIWFISALILYNILKNLEIKNFFCTYALLFYSFIPSSIFFSSSTFREPLMLLLTNIFIYCYINLFKSKNINNFLLNFFFILLVNYILAFKLHIAYIYISSIFIFFTFILLLHRILNYKKTYFIFYFFIFLFLASFQIEITNNFIFDLVEKSAIYRSNTTQALSSYNFTISENILINSLFAFIQFLFQPILFSYNSFAAYLFFFENIIKVFMMITFVINLVKTKNKKYNYIFISTFLIYLLATLIWSLGTTNWGTSIRHSFPQLGLLIFFYFGSLNNLFLNKKSV